MAQMDMRSFLQIEPSARAELVAVAPGVRTVLASVPHPSSQRWAVLRRRGRRLRGLSEAIPVAKRILNSETTLDPSPVLWELTGPLHGRVLHLYLRQDGNHFEHQLWLSHGDGTDAVLLGSRPAFVGDSSYRCDEIDDLYNGDCSLENLIAEGRAFGLPLWINGVFLLS